MATQHEIKATVRADAGKGASRRLRRTGQVPAVVYGGHAEPTSIEILHNTVWLASAHEWFYSSIIDLNVDGKVQKVILRDMQRHPVKPLIMHMDFMRVSADEAIRVRVPLHFLNQDSSPAGKAGGVVITHEVNEVEVSCLPANLPEYIELDLSSLKAGDTVHLSDIKLPAGVEIPELKLGKEHDVAVVIARQSKAGESDEAAEEKK
ncbi:50S ribosomal protein L25/general stress protein Ctc [uncultured Aquimonas sp.]|uniref:50S ribosomal protein L25/general stress protein Ctc n=1 Tax=uncultured Aquimonas sp. TaxID=385483 RepID=UPI00086E2F6A|nr:50S ribosomal protein L25/general stress protein Ctc [uncultured Aquimonas sp.]ODU47922.1 MAG: 50S ribosomal protein L25/general stress protein Ctc [Xanthomonadaceae bacterium SCN 69-123]